MKNELIHGDALTVLPTLRRIEGCEDGLPADDATRAVLEKAVVRLIKK